MRIFSRYAVTTAAVAAVIGAPALGLAQSEPQGQSTSQSQSQAQSSADLIGLSKALTAAEREVSGRALEAELDHEKGRVVYEVEVVTDSDLHEVVIDARSGEIVSTNRQQLEGLWQDWFGSERLDALRKAPRPLSEVVASVESETGDRVREVSLDEEGGQFYYEMELASAQGGERDILVEIGSGRILKDHID